ncbi:putative oxidoreductase [Actinocorallia herbida]|uniref:Putative oxidoreductase n=1 Tax=Actinocorallia herbida TaxID=58109 RepID=A0A3N1CSB7_9ACTN|nr:DoxX family protein [Actinocorallia herbida]ROO84187.1 putative oxidoreductase [Actinocorallia herbida]
MPSRLHDLAALLARTAVGVVFVAHGWLKIEDGVTATAAEFDRMGVPLAKAAAVYSTFAELLGGAALIVGLGLPVVGIALFLDMAGAFVFVHVDQGLSAPAGFELVIVLGLASLLFAAGGGGGLTLDRALGVRRARKEEIAEFLPPEDGPDGPAPYLPKRAGPSEAPEPEAVADVPASARDTVPEIPAPSAPAAPSGAASSGAASGDVVVARARRGRARGGQEKDAK